MAPNKDFDQSSDPSNETLPDVVAEEILHKGVNDRLDFSKLPPEKMAGKRTKRTWRLIVVFIVLTLSFILFSWLNYFGVFPFGNLTTVLVFFVSAFLTWFILGFVTLDQAVKIGHDQFETPLLGHWPYSRWVFYVGAVFGPLYGQLWALWGAFSNWRNSRDTVAVVYLILGLGWPIMYVSALYSLKPWFLTEVIFAGQQEISQIDLLPDAHFGPFNSFFFVFGSGAILAVAMMFASVGLWLQQRRRGKEASDALHKAGALREGESILKGDVQLEPGIDYAVQLKLFQNGEEEQDDDGDWSHRWHIDSQQIKTNPFCLKHPSGARVRVEPDEKVHLMQELQKTQPIKRTRRLRIAEIIEGNYVFATGILSRSERTDCKWVLKPSPNKPMILSTKPLDRPFVWRAKYYGLSALAVLGLFVVGQCLLVTYHLRVWTGEKVDGEIKTTGYTDKKGIDFKHHSLVLTYGKGVEFYEKIEKIPKELTAKLNRVCKHALFHGYPHFCFVVSFLIKARRVPFRAFRH